MLATQSPFPLYADLDGKPLEGFAYFGVANQNPETSPVQVYWDAAGTQPASQPIQISRGVTVRNGTPAVVYVATAYSIAVKNSRGLPVFYAADSATFGNSGLLAAQIDDLAAELLEKMPTSADYSSLQALLTANAGGSVRIIGAHNLGAANLSVPAGTSVDATGATLTWSAHTGGVTFAGSALQRSRWKGGKLIGPGGGAYVIGSMAMQCQGVNNAPSAPTFVLGPEVDDVEIDGWGEYGFFGAYISGGHFCGSPGVRNIGYGAVCGVSMRDFHATRNVISDIGPGVGDDAYGIFFSRRDGTSETAEPRSYDCIMAHNTVSDVVASGGGNGHALDTHGGVGIVINSNTIEDCQGGIFVTASSISGTQQLAPKHCTVTGNVIRSALRANYGILVSGAINAGVVAEYAESCTVTGNTVEGYGLAAGAISGGYRYTATRGLTVTGNTSLRSACNGMVFDAENIGFSVAGGSIIDPFDNTYASPNCILFAGNNNTGSVSDVTFSYINGALGTYVAIGSIRTNTGLTGLDLEFGRCPHIGIDSTHLQYLPITTTGINPTGLCEQSGSATLTAGSVTVTFPKRFPAVPRVMVTPTSDLNPIRAATVTATSATFGGTGTTAFTWRASL
jgi:hypothetical protein